MNNREVINIKKVKIYSGIVGALFLAFAFCLILLIKWSFTGKDVLEVKDNPVPISQTVDKDGNVALDISFCKFVDTPGRVVWKLVSNKTELLLPTYTDALSSGCRDNLKAKVPIPPQTEPGKYHINYRITYKTNPLHTVVEEFNSKEFTIQ